MLCSLAVEINSLIKVKIVVKIQKSEPQGTMIIVEGSRACRFRTPMGLAWGAILYIIFL